MNVLSSWLSDQGVDKRAVEKQNPWKLSRTIRTEHS